MVEIIQVLLWNISGVPSNVYPKPQTSSCIGIDLKGPLWVQPNLPNEIPDEAFNKGKPDPQILLDGLWNIYIVMNNLYPCSSQGKWDAECTTRGQHPAGKIKETQWGSLFFSVLFAIISAWKGWQEQKVCPLEDMSCPEMNPIECPNTLIGWSGPPSFPRPVATLTPLLRLEKMTSVQHTPWWKLDQQLRSHLKNGWYLGGCVQSLTSPFREVLDISMAAQATEQPMGMGLFTSHLH